MEKSDATSVKVPNVSKLEALMGGEGFEMHLQGADALVWEYAMTLSPDPTAGGTDSADQLHVSLEALVNAPNPSNLTNEQHEAVKRTLDQWRDRYDDQIDEAARNLASYILEILWI